MDMVDTSTPAVAEVNKFVAIDDIHKTILYIIKGTEDAQPRFVQRALRQNVSARKYVKGTQLDELLNKYIPLTNSSYENMLKCITKIKDHEATLPPPPVSALDEAAAFEAASKSSPSKEAKVAFDDDINMDIDSETKEEKNNGPPTEVLPEVEIYLFTLIVNTLLRYDLNQYTPLASAQLTQRCMAFNRRSLDLLASRAYLVLSLSFEKVNRLNEIRATLLKLYRTSCVRHDDVGQAVLLNLLLRNYLHFNLINQAKLLSGRTTFPETASNNQFCRFLYYMGRIQAIQLEYADSYKRLMWAARKSPQDTGLGFQRVVIKLTIIVQLLLGEIPERSVFNNESHRLSLLPYLELTKAVRAGDPTAFAAVVATYGNVFKTDKNHSLVMRLSHNVVKIGLRKISVSYSRISLQDITTKLSLQTIQGTEYICAKAIRDGVIDATIDHANSTLLSNDAIDVYATDEPQKAFHARIGFCLDVHNDAVKAMRYPGDAHRMPKKNKEEENDQNEKTIEELIAEMEEDED
jgi:26S proteasome regulatory subunit N3